MRRRLSHQTHTWHMLLKMHPVHPQAANGLQANKGELSGEETACASRDLPPSEVVAISTAQAGDIWWGQVSSANSASAMS